VLLSKPHEYWHWLNHTATYTDLNKASHDPILLEDQIDVGELRALIAQIARGESGTVESKSSRSSVPFSSSFYAKFL
jgi:hypothetical protein